jgi:hypothetical protein
LILENKDQIIIKKRSLMGLFDHNLNKNFF